MDNIYLDLNGLTKRYQNLYNNVMYSKDYYFIILNEEMQIQ